MKNMNNRVLHYKNIFRNINIIMNVNLNKLLYLLIIMALLYAMYRYQTHILSVPDHIGDIYTQAMDVVPQISFNKPSKQKPAMKKVTFIDSDIESDGVSQLTLGDAEDLLSLEHDFAYKQDSIFDSFDNNTVGSLFEDNDTLSLFR